ncbi:uncharacterized protein [Solanum lycopersicum]|uniref:uncharacterized protein isoform X2 n=2 Tax=Solanum lycopersicum TaxID=4081 RepID=UPI00374A289A
MISKLNHQMRVLFLPSIASASLHSHLLCNGIPLWFLLQLLLIPGVLSLLLRPLILAFFHSRCAFPARPFTDFRMKPNSCLCHQLGEIVRSDPENLQALTSFTLGNLSTSGFYTSLPMDEEMIPIANIDSQQDQTCRHLRLNSNSSQSSLLRISG